MKKYTPRTEMAEVYKIVIQQAWNRQTGHVVDGKKQTLKQIKVLEDKIDCIRELLSSRQLDPEEFKEMKSDYTAKIERLEVKLISLNSEDINIKGLLEKGIDNLLNLDFVYENAEIEKKRQIISSMFPEKMRLENNLLRTGRVNEAVKYIYLISTKIPS